MSLLFYQKVYKRLHRLLILWPKAILSKVDLHRYHKHLSVLAVAYVVMATLAAIENHGDGSWGMPIILFNVALLMFILGCSELILLADKRYKGATAKYKALSRVLSCYGVAATIIVMSDIYSFTVKY